jgi:hypothetical protein
MDKWKIVLVKGKNRYPHDLGYIYMDWEYLPFIHIFQALRMAGRYTLYLVLEE